jgi:hypothetical protein
LKTMSCFSSRKTVRQLSSFTTHPTTCSPQKHHSETLFFQKTPVKTLVHHKGKMR